MRATPTRRAIPPRNSAASLTLALCAVGLEEKEKLYLDCLDAYYNEGGKQLLSEDDYQKLKLDLEFSTSRVTVRQSCRRLPHASRSAPSSLPLAQLFSKDEIKFMIANKRYRMGKPILSDGEYDTLRKKLKGEGSVVALHDEMRDRRSCLSARVFASMRSENLWRMWTTM